MRLHNLSIRFGKAPYPGPEDGSAIGRLALAYGVRKDIFDLTEIIRRRLDLPDDFPTKNAIGQVVAALINGERMSPGTLDRFAAGKGLPPWATKLAVGGQGNSPELADAVLDDVRQLLNGASGRLSNDGDTE